MTNLIQTLLASVPAFQLLTGLPSLPPQAPVATAREAAHLQAEALRSTHPAVHAAWLMADLDHKAPRLRKGGLNRPYQVLSPEQASLPQVLNNIAAYETRAVLPAGSPEVLERLVYTFNKVRFLPAAQDQHHQIQSAMGQASTGNAGVAALSLQTRFTHIALGDGGWTGGGDATRDCSIKTSFQVRVQQLTDLATAIHEEGHLLERQKRGAAWRQPDAYGVYVSETLADTYLALRMAALLGDEGRAYIRHAALQQTLAVALDPEVRTALQHMTQESLLKAVDYSRRHDLSRQKPEELFALAEKIAVPVSRKDYQHLETHILTDDLPPPDAETARLYQKQSGLPKVVRQYYGLLAGAYQDYQGAAEALHRLNPLRTKGTEAQLTAFDPAYPGEYAATERFNQDYRPATCPPFAEQVKRDRKQTPAARP